MTISLRLINLHKTLLLITILLTVNFCVAENAENSESPAKLVKIALSVVATADKFGSVVQTIMQELDLGAIEIDKYRGVGID